MASDDDLDLEPTPDPDAPPSPSELARARGFGDLIDKVVAGRPPPAMRAGDRALAEVATAIRASAGRIELAPSRASALVEDALRTALEGRSAPAHAASEAEAAPRSRPSRWRRAAPWAVAAASLAAAAAVVLWLAQARPGESTASIARAPLPEHQRSRPADRLIGRIPRERAGDAADRIDAIFADRLAGYRDRNFTRADRGARRGAP